MADEVMTNVIEESLQYAQLTVQVEPTDAQKQQRVSVAPTPTQRIAVLVCHGMGQQVPFETLDAVVRDVLAAAHQSGTAINDDIFVSLHPDDGRFVARAELTLRKPDGSTVDVHFYEAYWAPLTEGRVTLRETLSFFVDAGRRGLGFAYGDGVFDRWMFGGRQEFEIPARRVLQLGLALWMLLLVTAAFAATALLPLIKVVDLFQDGRPDPRLAAVAATGFSIGLFLILFGIASAIVVRLLGLGADVERPKSVIGAPLGILAPRRWQRNVMLVVLAVLIIASAGFTLWTGLWMHSRWLVPAVTEPSSHRVSLGLAILLILLEAIILLKFVKGFLVEFAGDVAAYVSPYKVSKFEEIRHDIQERGRCIARFIYSAHAIASNDPLYNAVFVVGHSLGSVLAYDTLNDAINRDAHQDGWAVGSPPDAYGVVERTKLLLTFGSPLDKTAFVFRTQKPNSEIDVREALAAAVQPLILNYANRRGRWINIWSPSDWISGPLGYYDAPQPLPGQGVCNIENPGSRLPWKAHTEYWSGQTLRGVLHTALTGICPADVPEPQRSQIRAAFGSRVS